MKNKKEIYFTPGPSEIYPSVPNHIQNAINLGVPSWSHRSSKFKDLFKDTSNKIKEVMNAPKETHVFFLGSGTEGMERIIQNTVEKKSFHFVNGSFSKRMWKISGQLGKNAEKFESIPGTSFPFEQVNISKDTELICVTHNETSMGIKTNESDIANLSKKYPQAIFSVDVVSSAPCVDIDWKTIDCAFFSVQKCFGLPSGLGILMVNDKAIEKSREIQKRGVSIGSYHSFPSLLEDEDMSQTPETPNVLSMYLLGKVCEEFLEKGIQKIKNETKEKSSLLYDFFDNHKTHKPFINEINSRSDTVIVAKTPQGSKPIISTLKERKFIIGSGYAEYKDSCMRIANFPAHSKENMNDLIEELSRIW